MARFGAFTGRLKLKNFLSRKLNKKGFSVAELLIVVAIIVVLMAVAAPAVISIQKKYRQADLDAKAETIYTAVQNQLTKLKTVGNSAIYSYDSADRTKGVRQLNAVPCDIDEQGAVESGQLCFITSDIAGTTSAYLMNSNAMDESLLNNHWVVEYDPESAVVYAVFYSEDLADCASGYVTGYTVYDSLRFKANRLDAGAKVGYYGGGYAKEEKVTLLTPSLTITNAEKLVADISCKVSGRTDISVQFLVSLEDVNGHRYTETYDYSRITKSGNTYSLSIVLDGLSDSSERFVNKYGQGSGHADGTKLEAGPIKVTVTAMCPGDHTVTQNISDAKITNSLFADDNSQQVSGTLNDNYGSAASPAVIKCGRHLQNLDETSGVNSSAGNISDSGRKTSVLYAVQRSDIDFNTASGKSEYNWNEIYADGYFNGTTAGTASFKPIENDTLVSLTGSAGSSSYRIDGLTVSASSDAGLFATLSDEIEVSNMILTGTSVTSSNGAAGALAGSVSGASINNCLVYLEPSDLSGKSSSNVWISGSAAGGLIGEVNGGTVSISECSASTVVSGTASAGGLVGSAGRQSTVTISGSYADCYLDGTICGGLIGSSAGDVSISSSYAAGYVSFSSVGAGIAAGGADVSNSYTVISNQGSENGSYYSTVENGTASKVYYAAMGSDAGDVSGTTRIGTMTAQELQAELGGTFAVGVTSRPYNLAGQGLSSYDYPGLTGMTHYGDWEVQAYDADAIAEAVTGLVYNGDEQVGVTGTNVTLTGEKQTNAGTYTAVATPVEGHAWADGTSAAKEITYTIGKAVLSVIANANTITYGDEPSANGVTYSGFKKNDTQRVISGDVTFTYTYRKGNNVGTYVITPVVTNLKADNYSFTPANGVLTVKKADASWTTAPSANSLTYNGQAQRLVKAGIATGGTMMYSLEDSSWSTSIPSGTNAGTYTVYYYVKGDDNHNDSKTARISVQITKAAPTYTPPKARTLTYNGQAQSLAEAGTATGGTMMYSLDGKNWSASIPSGTNAGTYTVYYHVKGDDNHNDSQSAAISVQIGKADPTYTAPTAKTLTYNGQAQSLAEAGTATGGTMMYSLEDNSWSTSIPTGTNAGTYTVYYYVKGDDNHNDTEPQSIESVINKAVITVTANDSTITYGEAFENNGVTYSGFVNGENDSVISGKVMYSSDYSTGKGVGTYEIKPIVTSLSADNYTFEAVSGTLTVNKAVLTITADDQKITYGDNLPAGRVSYSGFVNGENESVISGTVKFSYTDKDGNVVDEPRNAGEYVIIPDISGLTASNYELEAANGTLQIDKAVITVTAKSYTINDNQDPANDGVEYSGFKYGDDERVISGSVVYSYNYNKGKPAGTYKIYPNVSNLSADNYTFTAAAGDLIVKGAIKVSLDKNNSNASLDVKEISVYTGDKYGELPVPTTTQKNWKFVGWYTAKEGGSQVYADTEVTAAADHTLYAHWEKVKVRLNYYGNVKEVEVNDDGTLNGYNKDDYGYNSKWELVGWYDSTAMSGKTASGTKVLAADGSGTITFSGEDVTLYALYGKKVSSEWYVLTDELVVGGNYVLVNNNSPTNNAAALVNNKNMAQSGITIKDANGSIFDADGNTVTGGYIEKVNGNNYTIWTVENSTEGHGEYFFEANSGGYLNVTWNWLGGVNGITVGTSPNRGWNYSGTIYTRSVDILWWESVYGIRYSNGSFTTGDWTLGKTSGTAVYLYQQAAGYTEFSFYPGEQADTMSLFEAEEPAALTAIPEEAPEETTTQKPVSEEPASNEPEVQGIELVDSKEKSADEDADEDSSESETDGADPTE